MIISSPTLLLDISRICLIFLYLQKQFKVNFRTASRPLKIAFRGKSNGVKPNKIGPYDTLLLFGIYFVTIVEWLKSSNIISHSSMGQQLMGAMTRHCFRIKIRIQFIWFLTQFVQTCWYITSVLIYITYIIIFVIFVGNLIRIKWRKLLSLAVSHISQSHFETTWLMTLEWAQSYEPSTRTRLSQYLTLLSLHQLPASCESVK